MGHSKQPVGINLIYILDGDNKETAPYNTSSENLCLTTRLLLLLLSRLCKLNTDIFTEYSILKQLKSFERLIIYFKSYYPVGPY